MIFNHSNKSDGGRNPVKCSRRRVIRVLSVIVLAAILFQTASCGTILYPERRGQRAGRIDPGVAILDGIGLLFFLVPGVVAFAVDFATGAIYLPHGHRSLVSDVEQNTDSLTLADIDKNALDLKTLGLIISSKTGQIVDLESANCKIFTINDPQFTETYFVK